MARTKQTARQWTGKSSKSEKHLRVLKMLTKKVRRSDNDGATTKPSKSRRWKQGTVSKRECKKFQSNKKDGTRLLVPIATISRRIRQIIRGYDSDFRVRKSSTLAIQSSLEDLLTNIFSKTGGLTTLRKQKTISTDNFLFCVDYYLPSYKLDNYEALPTISVKDSNENQ